MMTLEEFVAFCDSDDYPLQSGPSPIFEDKPEDWGFLDGRPVVVDYAARVHIRAAEVERAAARERKTKVT